MDIASLIKHAQTVIVGHNGIMLYADRQADGTINYLIDRNHGDDKGVWTETIHHGRDEAAAVAAFMMASGCENGPSHK